MGLKKQTPDKFELLAKLVELADKAEKDKDYMASATAIIWLLENLYPETFGSGKE